MTQYVKECGKMRHRLITLISMFYRMNFGRDTLQVRMIISLLLKHAHSIVLTGHNIDYILDMKIKKKQLLCSLYTYSNTTNVLIEDNKAQF